MTLQDIKTRDELPLVLNANGLVGLGVEVGVAFGGFSEIILRTWKGRHLFCIDPYCEQPKDVYREDTSGHHFEAWYNEVLDRLARASNGRAVVVREFSAEASNWFAPETFDFVYIDGNHSREAVNQDIECWARKIKPGGVLCGHDYYNRTDSGHHCFVKDAVDGFVKATGLKLVIADADSEMPSWFIRL